MNLIEHYTQVLEDVIQVHEHPGQSIDYALAFGMFPTSAGTWSQGYLVSLTMRSALFAQGMNDKSIAFGPQPDDSMFRSMVVAIITDLRERYDRILAQELNRTRPDDVTT